ncbi:A24 family peptidase [Clostridium sp. ATCC 25772]|uniref:prepilin peptidase n=1 Tax=Clostridium sp. ATCC 25772 TaxID=1676991 RepID=UPI000783D7FF|nr:A24 family peptidase [Clostridium sp. ATCC 25772]
MSLLVFILGIVIGSFLNVCIYRIPRGESVAYPPSHCYNCNKNLKWYDLFPIVSYIFLKGKCRYCKVKISIQYPIIELFTGIIYLLIYIHYGLTLNMFKYIILASFFIVIGIIDLKTTDIYDITILNPAVIGIIFLIYEYYIGLSISGNIIGILLMLFIIGGLILITKGMAIGDLEMYLLVPLYMGLKNSILVLLLSIIIGGVFGIVLILIKKKTRKDYIPFGPYITIATLIAMLYGENIINWYLNLII